MYKYICVCVCVYNLEPLVNEHFNCLYNYTASCIFFSEIRLDLPLKYNNLQIESVSINVRVIPKSKDRFYLILYMFSIYM